MAFPELTLNEPITYRRNTSSNTITNPFKGYTNEDLFAQQLSFLYALIAKKIKIPTPNAFDQLHLWERIISDQSSTDVSFFEAIDLLIDLKKTSVFEQFREDTLFDSKLPDLPVSTSTVKLHIKFEGRGKPDFRSELIDE